MTYLMRDLYHAFNPAAEMASPAWLLLSNGGKSEAELTREELIAQGAMLRQKLERELPKAMYSVLKLYFSEERNEEVSLIDIKVIKKNVIKEARIFAKMSNQFFNVCCLSECWGVNLFRSKDYKPMREYDTSVSYQLLCRRCCRIKAALKSMKNKAMERADDVLYSEARKTAEAS